MEREQDEEEDVVDMKMHIRKTKNRRKIRSTRTKKKDLKLKVGRCW